MRGLTLGSLARPGDPRAPDEDLMRHAHERGYVLFTHDLDFGTAAHALRELRMLRARPETRPPSFEPPAFVRATERRFRSRIALENFCTQLYEYDVSVPAELSTELMALAAAMGLRIPPPLKITP